MPHCKKLPALSWLSIWVINCICSKFHIEIFPSSVPIAATGKSVRQSAAVTLFALLSFRRILFFFMFKREKVPSSRPTPITWRWGVLRTVVIFFPLSASNEYIFWFKVNWKTRITRIYLSSFNVEELNLSKIVCYKNFVFICRRMEQVWIFAITVKRNLG